MSDRTVKRYSSPAVLARVLAAVLGLGVDARAAEPPTVATPAGPATPLPSTPQPVAEPAAQPEADPAAPPLTPAPTTTAPVAAEPTPPAEAGGFYDANADADDGATNSYPKLELSGFTDFTFALNVSSKSSPLRKIVQPYPSFSIGNLNVYLSASLAEKWRMLAEIRFMYLPQGNTAFPVSSGTQYVPFDASSFDYADDGRPLTWGGIQIQRVQIDYDLHPLFSLRVGQWLTPVGIWNVDHGSPTVIGVYRPYVVGQGIFPERQTGVQALGEWNGETNSVGYALTLSNGRGPSDAYADLDNNKAVGGRLYYTNNSFGSFTLGVSGYDGTYASRNKQYDLVGATPGKTAYVAAKNPLTLRYHERALGADLRWQWRSLLVQGEVLQHEVAYQDSVRPIAMGSLQANFRERGFYALVGYRTPWLGIMPFAMYEGLDFASTPLIAPGNAASVGLNVRPEANLVLKLQYHITMLGSDTSVQPYHGVLQRLLAQLAVAF